MKSWWWDDGGDNLALGRGWSLDSDLIALAERENLTTHFPFSAFARRCDASFAAS